MALPVPPVPHRGINRRSMFAVVLLWPFGEPMAPARVPHTTSRKRERLFIIARSKNANIVVYDYLPNAPQAAQLTGPAGLSEASPLRNSSTLLDVYWLMNAEDGRRQELNLLERRMAYGYRVDSQGEDGSLTISLMTAADRKIGIRGSHDGAVALTAIKGRQARLDRIFVQAKEGSLLPRVLHVDLIGRDAETGRGVTERVVL